MVKASNADMEMAQSLSGLLESLEDGYFPSEQKHGEDVIFDDSDSDDCIEAMRRILSLLDQGSLSRVVQGMSVLLDPMNEAVDPNDDCLALHPKYLAVGARAETVERR